jgi:hypothetical protein
MPTKTEAAKILLNAGWSIEDVVKVLEINIHQRIKSDTPISIKIDRSLDEEKVIKEHYPSQG